MTELIDASSAHYQLGVESMDKTHKEFIGLVNKLGTARNADFITLFAALIDHTKIHFCAENTLMEETGFPAIHEHKDEHQRVLGDLNRIGKRVSSGSVAMGRSYITEQLPEWFSLHAITMDSALAAHIKSTQ